MSNNNTKRDDSTIRNIWHMLIFIGIMVMPMIQYDFAEHQPLDQGYLGLRIVEAVCAINALMHFIRLCMNFSYTADDSLRSKRYRQIIR